MPQKPIPQAPTARTELIKAARRLRAESHMQTAAEIGSMIDNHLGFAKGFGEPDQSAFRAPDNSIPHTNYRPKRRG